MSFAEKFPSNPESSIAFRRHVSLVVYSETVPQLFFVFCNINTYEVKTNRFVNCPSIWVCLFPQIQVTRFWQEYSMYDVISSLYHVRRYIVSLC